MADHVVHEEVHACAGRLPGAVQARKAISDGIHALQQWALEIEAIQVGCHWLLTQGNESLQHNWSP